MAILHDDSASGHLGIDKTEGRFLEAFYWPNIKKIIAWYIKQCEKCEIFKTPKENSRTPLQPIVSHRILELLVIDFIGPISISRQDNRYILSMIDHFSKYAVTFATSRQDTQTVISCLKKFFTKFGPVERILTDNDRSFISKEFMEFAKTWSIKKSTSTAYHAQTQELCEKWNGTIVQILKRYVNDTAETWDENLDMATYAYNTAIQRTNGMTPYEVMFGKKVNTSISFLLSRKNLSESDYLMTLQLDISKINHIITENQEAAHLQIKEKYDRKRGKAFKVGEQVMLFNPFIKLRESKKFATHYKGPYIIEKKQSETNYVLQPLKEGLREEIVHQNRLKRSFSKVETMQRPANTKEIEEVKSKWEELMKFLLPTPNVTTATTTDSDGEWWEVQISTTCSMPRQLVGTEKSDNTKLVDITSQKDEIMGAMAEKTTTEFTTIGETNILPQQEITDGRLMNTPSTDIPTLVPSPDTVDFKTPASHKTSTPVEQRLDEEFNQLRQFEEHESNELTHEAEEQSASTDDLGDEDADTESLYEPAREITPVPSR